MGQSPYILKQPSPHHPSIPSTLPVPFNPAIHQFQSKNIQRIKQTPFTNCILYSASCPVITSSPSSLPLLNINNNNNNNISASPIFIDAIDITLKELLIPRVGTHQLFPPNEILKILRDVVNGLCELQLQQYYEKRGHGDVSYDTIYYDRKNKKFMLRHPIFNTQSGYALTKKGKRFSMLSPQQLLQLSSPQQTVNNLIKTSIKSDLFILAIIALQLCTLIPSNQIYCPQTYVIFDKQIQNRLQLIKQNYRNDQVLCERILKILHFLLEYDQSLRKSTKEILWMFQEFQKNDINSINGGINLETNNVRSIAANANTKIITVGQRQVQTQPFITSPFPHQNLYINNPNVNKR